jgi:hypothetical protein
VQRNGSGTKWFDAAASKFKSASQKRAFQPWSYRGQSRTLAQYAALSIGGLPSEQTGGDAGSKSSSSRRISRPGRHSSTPKAIGSDDSRKRELCESRGRWLLSAPGKQAWGNQSENRRHGIRELAHDACRCSLHRTRPCARSSRWYANGGDGRPACRDSLDCGRLADQG